MAAQRTGLLTLALLCTIPALSQRLAQRNWQGSGLTAQTWWPRATLCSLDLRTDRTRGLSGVIARLDEFQTIGCEALVLDILNPPGTAGSPVSLTFGTLEDTDNLIEQMGRRKIRLILDLPLSPTGEPAGKPTLSQMSFWLSRGVAGFLLPRPADSPDTATFVHQAHQVAASALGTRILIGEGPESPAAAPAARRTTLPDLQLTLRHLPPARDRATIETLRSVLAATSSGSSLPLLALDDIATSDSEGALDPEAEIAFHRAQAAILLGQGAATMLPLSTLSPRSSRQSSSAHPSFSPEELGLWVPAGGDPLSPSPQQELAGWLRSLNDLRHTSPALRTGTSTYLDLDLNEFLAWIVRPKGSGAPLLFVCNLSSSAAHVSLAQEMQLAGIHATSLRTVLRSDPDPAQQPATLESIDLPSNGVLIAELR